MIMLIHLYPRNYYPRSIPGPCKLLKNITILVWERFRVSDDIVGVPLTTFHVSHVSPIVGEG